MGHFFLWFFLIWGQKFTSFSQMQYKVGVASLSVSPSREGLASVPVGPIKSAVAAEHVSPIKGCVASMFAGPFERGWISLPVEIEVWPLSMSIQVETWCVSISPIRVRVSTVHVSPCTGSIVSYAIKGRGLAASQSK